MELVVLRGTPKISPFCLKLNLTLFDGKNLDHWQGDGNANFAIDDGSNLPPGQYRVGITGASGVYFELTRVPA
jgi:hypothetical protein